MYYDLNSEGDNRTITIGSKEYLLGELNEEQKQEIINLLPYWSWEGDKDKLKEAWTSIIKKILAYFNDTVDTWTIKENKFDELILYVNKQLGLWE